LAELLGYIAGDGHVDALETAFFNTVEDMRNRVSSLMEKCFGFRPFTVFPRERSPMVVIRSKALAKVFNLIFGFPLGKKAANFVLPAWILNMNKENTSRFIRAYFDCDGSVGERGIEFATASPDVAQKMQLMLLKFGIISFVKPKIVNGVTYHRIFITGENIDIYAKEIGFMHPKKRVRLQSARGKKRNTNVDTIPNMGMAVDYITKALEIETHGKIWGYTKGKYAFGREKLSRFLNLAEKAYEEKRAIDDLQRQINAHAKAVETAAELVKKQPRHSSFRQVARKVGLSERIVKKYLNGSPDPRPLTLKKLCAYFKIDVEIPGERLVFDALKLAVAKVSHERLASASEVSIGTISGIANGMFKRSRLKTLECISKGLARISSEMNNAYDKLFELKKLACSDIFWDRITEIAQANPKEEFVYDIEVEGSPNFVANGIIAHNTSFAGSMMVEIMSKTRVIVTEDTLELPVTQLREIGYNIQRLKSRSVITHVETELPAEEALRTALRLGDSALILGEVRSSIPGWEEVFVVENGIAKRIPIEILERKDRGNYKIPTLGFDLKVGLKNLAGFVKHPERDRLLEVITKTGRRITVTPEHSLFHAAKDFRIAPVECRKLMKGDSIVIPTSIPVGFNDVESINVLEILPEFRLENFESDTRRAIEKLGWKRATEVAGVTSGDIYNYFRTAPNQQINLPVSSFQNLMQESETDYNPDQLRITRGTGNAIPATIPVNEEFCRFLGYYVSEGYYALPGGKGGNVILTNSNEHMLEDMASLSRNLFGIEPTTRKVYGAGESTQVRIGSSALATLVSRLGCGRTCTEKRIPSLIFGLSKPKVAAFLRGLFSGDGCFTASKSSGNSIRYASTSRKLAEDVSYLLLAFGIVGTIRHRRATKLNCNDIWTVEFKDREMVERFLREIGFEQKSPKMLIKGWQHTSVNTVRFSKEALKKHLTMCPRRYRHLFRFEKCSKRYLRQVVNDSQCKVSEQLKIFANGEFFLDEVKEIREIKLEKPVPVYDLSIEPSQNFIGGFGGILLHNTEAIALYEAMRIGALANVVAGTIHGDSAYGVFDRVVNDLGVPPTSFKATDIVLVANVLRSPDGMHAYRRITEITEVRKHWKDDPGLEGGFVPLMEYNAKEDKLKPTQTLLMGESQILNDISNRVKDWRANWPAVWDTINLRARIIQSLVEMGAKNPALLEADFVMKSKSMFHTISEE
ncbi:hypothetical protein HY501_02400, partial [Candidatus Woesearchaeota archaeon]|nr:hypothetical protein [Candidatus Woesearchaeota archaeon]